MRRFLSRNAADHANDSITSSPNASLPVVYRLSASQDAVFQAGLPIAALDRSPDGRSAVLAGRHILKIVRLDNRNIEEHADLRAVLTSQVTRGNSIAPVSDQLSIKDVKWASATGGAQSLFTACANGKIFNYDITRSLGAIGRPGTPLEVITIREDTRQVNTLDVNPHRDSWLLSGSQDGFVRCFDTRDPVSINRGGLTFRQIHAGKCNDSVRHVKWSPKEGFCFACCTDSGVVMKWDSRMTAKPVLRLNAHETNRACTAVAWHHDGDHLASAGTDAKLHVWDASPGADKRQKPKLSISLPAPAAAITWRPGQWSATVQGRRAAQIAVSYDNSSGGKRQSNAVVHLWDFARPTMPYREVNRFEASPMALLWLDSDLLWTAGPDGIFSQCDVAFAPKVIDRTPVSTMAFSSRGDVAMFLDERTQPRRPRVPASLHRVDMLPPPAATFSNDMGGSSPTSNMFSMGRSDSEDEVVTSFLAPRKPDASPAVRSRRASLKSSPQNVSTTPPSSTTISNEPAVPLETSLRVAGIFRNRQCMAVGPLPAAQTTDVYRFLSTHYLETLQVQLPHVPGGKPMVDRVVGILERYAQAAEAVSHFRLAQTWRILAFAMDRLLRSRAQYHLGRRMQQAKLALESSREERAQAASKIGSQPFGRTNSSNELASRRQHVSAGARSLLGRSLLADEFESSSSVPTPLALPVGGAGDRIEVENTKSAADSDHNGLAGHAMTPLLELENFSLPPAAHQPHPGVSEQRARLDSTPISEVSQDSDNTQDLITEGYDFYDMDAMSKAMDMPPPNIYREPVALPREYSDPTSSSPEAQKHPTLLRKESTGSAGNMFSFSQTSIGSLPATEGSASPKFHAGGMLRGRHAGPTSAPSSRPTGESPASAEFHGRIRGRDLSGSPKYPTLKLLHQQKTMMRPTGATNDTQNSDDYHPDQLSNTQTTAESPSPSKSPGAHFPLSVPQIPPSSPPSALMARKPSEDEGSLEVIEGDYLPWQDDPPYPFPPRSNGPELETSSQDHSPYATPVQPYALLSRALEFEKKHSALNASAMILLLKPLVPDGLIDAHLAASILRQHHSRLMGMRLFVEAALLRKLCVRGWPGGVLENYWVEGYPAISSQAQHGVAVAYLCPTCKRPREIDRSSSSTESIWEPCKRCRTAVGPCAICGHREVTAIVDEYHHVTKENPSQSEEHVQEAEPAFDPAKIPLSTWWYCPTCAHGGHASCMSIWHGVSPSPPQQAYGVSPGEDDTTDSDLSDGCCPVDGCGHACLPGRWLAESTAARTDELSRASLREAAAVATATAARTPHLAAANNPRGSPTLAPGGGGGTVPALAQQPHLAAPGDLTPVRGDAHEAPQSRAVDGVREALAGAAAAVARRSGTTSLSSSPGRATGGLASFGTAAHGERERRKSVKFAGAYERRS